MKKKEKIDKLEDLEKEKYDALKKLGLKGFIAMFATMLSFVGAIASFNHMFNEKENQDISSQIESLDDFSKDLESLQVFIETQKEKLASENAVLENMKIEKERLKPLLAADKKIVESVFLEQEKRQRKEVWYERAFGFFIGILSSIFATFIILIFDRKRKKKKDIVTE